MKSDPDVQDRFAAGTAAQPNEFAEENDAMEAFIEERTERFVLGSREPVLNELLAHANATGGNGYVCLVGAPGSGKSALLAHLYREMTNPPQRNAETIRDSTASVSFRGQPAVVIPHFVGASAGSTDVRRTLRRLCHELKKGCPEITADIPDDFEKLRAAFPDFLRQACASKRIVILLDAVNQFDTTAYFSGLHWLPEELPENARVVLSVLVEPRNAPNARKEGDATAGGSEEPRNTPNTRNEAAASEVRSPAFTRSDGTKPPEGGTPNPTVDALHHLKPREIELKPLTANDGEAIIEQFRKRYHKRFSGEQRTALLAKTEAGTPLYLLTALEELRTLGTYEEITRRITELPSTTNELFAWILERLENDDGFRDVAGRKTGKELVSRFAALLGASRYGLSQRELFDLLAPGDPQGNVAALLHLLRPYLMRRGQLLDFYHGQLNDAGETKYLRQATKRTEVHCVLANYFRSRTDPAGDGTWASSCSRSLSELPYHQSQGQMWEPLERTLSDLAFVEAKSSLVSPFDLLDDYDRALQLHSMPASAQVQRALRIVMPSLSARPALALQTVCNQLIWFESLEQLLAASLADSLRRLDLRSYWIKASGPLPETTETDVFAVPFPFISFAQALSADKRFMAIVSQKGELEIRSLPKTNLLSARSFGSSGIIAVALSEDAGEVAYMQVGGRVCTERTHSGFAGRRGERGVLAYHSAHGVFVVSDDNVLTAWDPVRGRSWSLATNLPRPTRVIRVAPDGRRVFFVAGDSIQARGISTWSSNAWETKPLSYSGAPIIDADVHWQRDTALLACRDYRLRVLDLKTGAVLHELAYEADSNVAIRGAPVRCAIGFGDTEGWAFLATSRGQAACWNWHTGALCRLEDYQAITETTMLILFETVPPKGHLFVSTDSRGKGITLQSRPTQRDRHFTAVTDCVLTDAGKIITLSDLDQTVRWFSVDGLHSLGLWTGYAPSAIASVHCSDDVLIGTKQGQVMRLSPAGAQRNDLVSPSLLEPIASLFDAGDNETICAGKYGKIVRLHLPCMDHRVIRHGTGHRVQHMIFPAGNTRLLCSVHAEDQAGGTAWSITLVTNSGTEEQVLLTQNGLEGVAMSADGSSLCVSGKAVTILRRGNSGWATLCSRNVPAKHVAFLSDGSMIVVGRWDAPWIEVWKVSEQMETVAAIAVPAEVSCLRTKSNRIAAGLASGALLSLELRGRANTSINFANRKSI
jgi:WD40 repeat protein